MNTLELLVKTQAKVLSTWRDDDGYGNTDSDYMTMHLEIPTWGKDRPLLARLHSIDEEDEKMSPDSTWTRTYLHVNHFSVATPSTAAAAAEANPPTFNLLAMFDALTESHATVAWDTFDPYEGAMFTSHAKLQLKEPREPRLEVKQICVFRGHVEGTGRDQLVMDGCTPMRATRVER